MGKSLNIVIFSLWLEPLTTQGQYLMLQRVDEMFDSTLYSVAKWNALLYLLYWNEFKFKTKRIAYAE